MNRIEMIDQYLDLCDEFEEDPEVDKHGEPDPYCRHARELRKRAQKDVVAVEQNPPGNLNPMQAELVKGVGEVVGNAIGQAIGKKLQGITDGMDGIREELRENRKEQARSRKQTAAGTGPGRALTDDEWSEHEQNAIERFGRRKSDS